MKKLASRGFFLIVAFSLAGCNGGGIQSLLPPSASANLPTVNGSAASESSHQLTSSGEVVAQPGGYTITDLGTLGGTSSYPNDITSSGAMAGFSTLTGDNVNHGFVWPGGGRLIDIGVLPTGSNSDAISVNNSLQVVGTADVPPTKHDDNACYCGSGDLNSPFKCHSVLWQHGTLTDLGTLGGDSSIGEWINNRGQIVGISQINSINPYRGAVCSFPGSQINRAYLFENGRFRDLGTLGGYNAAATIINDPGQIAGSAEVATKPDPRLGFVPSHAVLWTNGVMKDLGTLGGGLSVAFGLNAEGAVAGYSTLRGEQHTHAFRWQDGAIIDLGVLNGDTDSWALGMNSRGQVVGFSYTSTTTRAFLQQRGVMTDLNTLISPTSGFVLATGNYINDAGVIAAQALVKRTGELHTVLLTPCNNNIRGNPGSVPLTEHLRKLLLRGYGQAI